MQKDARFGPTSNGGPNWDSAVRIWNQTADSTDGIYYKLVEQLKSYYTSWKTNLNIKTTLSLTHNERAPVRAALLHPTRATNVPSIAHHHLQTHTVHHGFMEVESHEGEIGVGTSSGPSVGDHVLSAHATEPSHDNTSLTGTSGAPLPVTNVPTTSVDSGVASSPPAAAAQEKMFGLSTAKVKKAHISHDTDVAVRKPRHCMKCGSGEEVMCGGRRGIGFCTKPCQDCHKIKGCLGRDPKSDRPCWEVKEKREKLLGKKRKRNE
ncbi:hypothetical protein BKA70DRAFT_1229093 [Coprinopsis sp. MPI-PUGE-AT-0042]|nr:hypothetical protein BKA70DRAFT_1229093 [Coprinopsis sp. MPI-PUGE-AT-0042]